ncbi:hypothetical protein [Actinomadura sp. HBU206391]|uniref:hypothetical protein n=1 Tax=Actinomadura sp. HBU206391 TaxID=2731692 RepID=UPI00164F33A9|nr:hypothetical protein [Actinomadura sp. HBU206391]MBC6461230.1 hypothetical protein [Actinomadura sp. HBU206391]
MRRRLWLGIGGWLAAVVAATGVGIAAIGVLEDGITGSQAGTLDQDAVQRALSSPFVPPASPPSPTSSAGQGTPAPGEVTRVLSTEGGKVTATCSGGLVRLGGWSPALGYGADDAERGPAAEASLTFESDDAEYEVTVRCAAEGPVASTHKDDGHGRHDGHGRDGD